MVRRGRITRLGAKGTSRCQDPTVPGLESPLPDAVLAVACNVAPRKLVAHLRPRVQLIVVFEGGKEVAAWVAHNLKARVQARINHNVQACVKVGPVQGFALQVPGGEDGEVCVGCPARNVGSVDRMDEVQQEVNAHKLDAKVRHRP